MIHFLVLVKTRKVHKQFLDVLLRYSTACINNVNLEVYIVLLQLCCLIHLRILSQGFYSVRRGILGIYLKNVLVVLDVFFLQLRIREFFLHRLLVLQQCLHSDFASVRSKFYCVRHKVKQNLQIPMLISVYVLQEDAIFWLKQMRDEYVFLLKL